MQPTHHELIGELVASGALRSTNLIPAFRKVDRKDFVPDELQHLAYIDGPLPIGSSATISQPSTVAFMLELLQPQEGDRILDVGAGSGWTTALLSQISPGIEAVEIRPELVEYGNRNLRKYGIAPLIRKANGYGIPDEEPYDKILVSAAADEVPQELLYQLRIGGVMVIPVQSSIWRLEKTGAHTQKIEKYPGYAFVPLRRYP